MAQNKNRRQKRLQILIPVLVIALVASGIGIYHLATYESANHADRLSKADLLDYNTTVTAKAQLSGIIGQNEVLILHSLSKASGKDPEAVFYIYQLPQGEDPNEYLSMQADDVPADTPLLSMGSLTCRLVESDPISIYDMQTRYIR